MATDLQPHPEQTQSLDQQSMTSLAAGIAKDAQELLTQHLTLLKVEAREEMRKITDAAIALLTGMAVALVGAILLGFMFVYLLATYRPEYLWAWFGVVGGVVAGIGGGLIAGGIIAFRNVHLPPPQSAEAVKEDLEWQTRQK